MAVNEIELNKLCSAIVKADRDFDPSAVFELAHNMRTVQRRLDDQVWL
jgi:hypothetical protein